MRKELENILNDNVPNIDDKEIWMWGTGNTASLYQEGFARLIEEGFHIEGYVDSNPKKQGEYMFGCRVIAPSDLNQRENVMVLICSPQPKVIKSIRDNLKALSIEYYLVDEVILKLHADKVLECYDMLDDEESKKVYATVIKKRLLGEYPKGDVVSENQYFEWSKFAGNVDIRRFVDCGAYVGDSVERYIWYMDGVFDKIVAFEPDKNNFQAMRSRVSRLLSEWNLKEDNISLYPYGVGDKNIKGSFESYEDNNGLGSKFTQANADVENGCQIVSLDEFFKEPYSFLKADIESFEYKMLLGARKGIKKWKPNMAICIYHNAVDIYSIPILIKTIVPEYKMAVRHYTSTLSDTVLYCWIED